MTPIATKLSLSSLLLLATLSGAQARPPTLDPTYGLPLPPKASTVAAAAKWIWADTTKDNQTVYVRRTFDLAAVPPKATLYLTADDFFTLFVNGSPPGVDHSFPDPKDNNVWQHVHRVNIAPFPTARPVSRPSKPPSRPIGRRIRLTTELCSLTWGRASPARSARPPMAASIPTPPAMPISRRSCWLPSCPSSGRDEHV